MPVARHPTLRVLSNRDARNFVSARLFSSFGRSLLHATLHWHLWKATDSVFNLGLLGLIEFLPVIPVSLVAGAIADSRDRRRIVILAQAASLGTAAVLCFGSLQPVGQLALVLLAALALAVAACFENPAGAALLPGLVSRELFPAATVLSANVRNVATVSGPVAMGFVVAWGGIASAYAATVVLLAASVGVLFLVRSPAVEGGAQPVTWRAIREGLSFVVRHKVILGSLSLDMFSVFFASVDVLLPVFATEILGVGEKGYGILSASTQVGTVMMSVVLLGVQMVRPGRALVVSIFFFGAATIAFGLTGSFWLAVLALVATGMADQVSMVARSIILQLSTPDALRGRVNAVNMIFIGASNELGAAESGFLASLTSATFSVVFGGLACLGVLGAVTAGVPTLWPYRPVDAELEARARAPAP